MKNEHIKRGLGALIRVHKTSIWNYWWLILLSILILLILMILVSAGSRNETHADNLVPYAIFGTLASLPIFALVYQIKNEARFYENGVVYENRRHVKMAHWAEIKDVWEWCVVVDAHGVPLPGQMFYGLRTVDGMTIRFSPRLDDIQKLGELLKSEAVKWGVPIREGIPPAKRNLMTMFGKQT